MLPVRQQQHGPRPLGEFCRSRLSPQAGFQFMPLFPRHRDRRELRYAIAIHPEPASTANRLINLGRR